MMWTIILILAIVAVLVVLLPLVMRKKSAVLARDVIPAVLVDQLDEVKRDLDRGVISPAEASGAEVEIKRRILAASRGMSRVEAPKTDEGRVLILVAALFVPALAFGYYAAYGSPGTASLTIADRAAAQADAQEVVALTQKLYDRLTSDPEGGPSEGWQLLGQTYMRMGRFDQAAEAFETLSGREDATSATWSMLAEALISADQGVVSRRADAAIDKAIELDSENPAGAFYKAMSLAQTGDEAGAHDLLVSRLQASDGSAPWIEVFVAEANRIGSAIGREPLDMNDIATSGPARPGPSAADVAAAQDMSEAERSDFIRSMVERLASRLEDEPDDLEGWLRLANAYTVLDERAQAISAYEKADALLADAPADDAQRKQIRQALEELKG